MPLIATEKPAGEFKLDLGSRVATVMNLYGYEYSTKPGEWEIIYVEGINTDGVLNDDAPNKFNDVRMVMSFAEEKPIIKGIWQATTEPGKLYTVRPVNHKGAARIKFGQYEAWQVGMHRGNHEALVQTGGPVTVCRDLNKDYEREGDKEDTGYFGINQHRGYDSASDDIGSASAGCFVGRTKKGHREFMVLVKSDSRYKSDPKFIFRTTILDGRDVDDVV